MTVPTRRISYVSIDDIKPTPDNPRQHSRTQIHALASSIATFGFNAPILVDRHMRIIAGHGRLEAARLLGLDQVPVICLDDLSDVHARAYMLADNKLCDRSTWDDPLLAAHLKELNELTLDFDLEVTGFELPEIDLRIQALDENPADAADEFAHAKGPIVSRQGDCWHLDEHWIFCGSALDPASYNQFPPGVKAAAAFLDAPYNVKIDGHVSGLGQIKHPEFAQASGEMTQQEYTSFLTAALLRAKEHSQDDGVIYSCIDWRHLGEMLTASQACNLSLINICVWVKNNGGMGSFYRSRHEMIFVLKREGVAHRNNIELGKFGRNRSNVWHYAGPNTPQKGKKRLLEYHPTPKPVALVGDALRDCTARGDYVLDPFLGSGTTLLAAENTGRKCLGIELEPRYVDTAILRWQKMTGQSAKLANGRTFAEVDAERNAL